MSSSATLGIAVVHYRAPAVALDCLERVRRAAPEATVVLVDTAPEPEFQRELAREFPEVEFVPTANHSYSHAVNVGLDKLNADYLVFMNADVLVERETFTALRAVMASYPRCGVIGPLALLPSGKPQSLGVPYQRHYRRVMNAQRAADDGVTASVPVRWVAGCLQLVRREAWLATGGYDETLRFFNEDLEFCLRLAKSGWQVRLAATPVVHLGGSSTPDHGAFHVEGRRGGMMVTQRYYPRPVAWLQLAYLWSEALAGSLLARDPRQRAKHLQMLKLLRSGDLSRSPFGATLDERE